MFVWPVRGVAMLPLGTNAPWAGSTARYSRQEEAVSLVEFLGEES